MDAPAESSTTMTTTTNTVRLYKGEVSDGRGGKLSAQEFTRAVARYATRHGYSAATVRTMTSARAEAIYEWMAR